MSEFLYHYHPVEPATWFYLSSLLSIGLFFKFSRFWSVRNLDLVLLILLGPGLLFIYYGRTADQPAQGAVVRREIELAGGDGQANSLSSPSTIAGGEMSQGARPSSRPDEGTRIEQEQGTRQPVLSSVATGEAGWHGELTERGNPTDNRAPASNHADRGEDVLDGRTRGERIQKYGYVWLLGVSGLLIVRLLSDATMVRRPLLEPNLSAGGLSFIGCSLFVFLMANVISRPADELADVPIVAAVAVERDAHLSAEEAAAAAVDDEVARAGGPGYALLARLPAAAKKVLVIVAHLTIVVGMVLVGYRHFDNIIMGVGAATLYLMLPYTALMTNEIKHVLPAASLVWAILSYRRPLAAGLFLGMAAGMSYYPLFLLPLWVSFYWPRGLLRFVTGVGTMLCVLLFVLFSSSDVVHNIRLMFGVFPPAVENLGGIWDLRLGGWSSYYRIPVIAAFVALASSLALWPAQKNLGTLLSCSAAVMVATQFWHGYGGGTYMAWYLPLLLLTIFRPNLEDRVALTVLAEGWLPRRLGALPTGKAA